MMQRGDPVKSKWHRYIVVGSAKLLTAVSFTIGKKVGWKVGEGGPRQGEERYLVLNSE